MTFLVSDGVVPSNEERGYVLRRIIRRAVRYAYRLGAKTVVTPALVDASVEVMGEAYPDLVKHHDVIVKVVAREEERFRQTLERGLDLLDDVLAEGDVSGERAFFLHDTLGFPVDLTREIAEERGRRVDYDGFRARMEEQRTRAREAVKADGGKESAPVELYRELVADFGETEFTGRHEYETTDAKVLALISGAARGARPAREAGGLARRARSAALRFQPLPGGHAGRARPHRGPRQPRDHHRRARPPLRDDPRARRGDRSDRVLR